MTARHSALIATGLLVAALSACGTHMVEADDSKPSTTASPSDAAPPSPAPGAPAGGGNDLALADAIALIPHGTEDRTSYNATPSTTGSTRTRTTAPPATKYSSMRP